MKLRPTDRYAAAVYFLILVLTYPVTGQQKALDHYTIHNGLPSNTVYDILQDARGFIWLATDHGLSRFDGHHFENFTSREGLPDNEVLRIKEDAYGRCWLWLYNRKPCYVYNDKVYSSDNDSLCRQIEALGVHYDGMFFNKDGQFCLSGKEIYVVGKNVIHSRYPNGAFYGRAYYFFYKGHEYFCDVNGIYRMENGRKVNLIQLCASLHPFKVLYDPFYHNGRVFFNTHSWDREHPYHLNYIAVDSSSALPRSIIPPGRVINYTLRKDGKIWLCTDAGLYILDPVLFSIANAAPEFVSIPVSNLMEDDHGNRWITTLNSGVYMQPAEAFAAYNTQSGLSDNNVMSVCHTPDGKLIAGHDKSRIDIINHGKISTMWLKSFQRNRILALQAINNEEVLVGSDDGIALVNIPNGRYRWIKHTGSVKSVIWQNNYCLFASSVSAVIYDISKKVFHRNLINDAICVSIVLDSSRHLVWMGTLHGLYYYSYPEGNAPYRTDDSLHKWDFDSVVSHCRITSMAMIHHNNLVIGTHKNGVFIYCNQRLLHLTQEKGLSSNACRKIIADSNEQVWVITDIGLDKIRLYNNNTFSIDHFAIPFGLSSTQINDITLDKGKAYIATTDGLVVMQDKAGAETPPPVVYILSIQMKDTLIHYPKNALFDYRQNEMQVNYTGVSFSSDNIRYRYLLQGGRDDTVYTASSSVHFSAMPPGAYRLIVWAAGANGRWSASPAIVSFTIRAPFWETLWFKVITALSAVLILLVLVKFRVDKVRRAEQRKTEQVKKMAEFEMQALRAQINPHFLFNALNAIQSYYSKNDEQIANHYMSTFARLIRQTLQYANINWLTIVEEMDMLKTYIELEQMRLDKSFDYEIIIDNSLQPERTLIPAMLLQPYVENAIHHGLQPLVQNKGRLKVSCTQEGAYLHCTVEDNGVGFSVAIRPQASRYGHRSMGMSITQQRIASIKQLYGIDIRLNIIEKKTAEGSPAGVIIDIIMPIDTLISVKS